MEFEVKKFTTDCLNNSGGLSPVTLYIGHPFKDSHPLAFQSRWLSNRGISIPQNIMDSFSKLMEISEKNNLPFVELVDYVIKEVELGRSLKEDAEKATEIANETPSELMQSSLKVTIEDQENYNKNETSSNQTSIGKTSIGEIEKNIASADENILQSTDNIDLTNADESTKIESGNEADQINNNNLNSLFKKVTKKN